MTTHSSEESVTGNLEDTYCYGTMGAKDEGHKLCAIKCASHGIPVTLIDSGTERSYILLPARNLRGLPDSVIRHMEDRVTVTGKEYDKNGVSFLVVDSVGPAMGTMKMLPLPPYRLPMRPSERGSEASK
jgi:hypothetical protein